MLVSTVAAAATFTLPKDGSTVVGEVKVVVPTPDNTLLDLMRHFDLGYAEITSANPKVSVWTPGAHTRVVIPTRFILPPKPWQGIVVNIPQRRMYYFPPPRKGQPAQVITYPISIAREGWSTPLGSSKVTAKYRDPGWFVPKSIRDEHMAEEGVELPEYFPPGPDNPMGILAMRTGWPGIFLHATNRPWGLGMRTSHGCMHLYPEDAAELFPQLKIGTPFRVINQPVLVGEAGGQVWMASYEAVGEYPDQPPPATLAASLLDARIMDAVLASRPLDQDRVRALLAEPNAVPQALDAGSPPTAELLGALPAEPYAVAPYGIDANDASLPEPRQRNDDAASAGP
ncbi:L,D-transpeptidase [Jeongeupia sp. USM3]|uniref:L,D-transpeptidase n=1 Tax=Jeongeupia sp. USM3 TaxID=1906741 RepID=UPI0011AB85DD|nr:L,D-transpeptidase family protein [Jeongeupia sp. USM3]